MLDKLVNKENLIKIITFLLIFSLILITISIFTDNNDGRRQIIDMDGGREERLCAVLSSIKGVGAVEALVEYDDNSKVIGVIVSAEGADNPIVENNITNGVATLYNIPVSSVIVFEKEGGLT